MRRFWPYIMILLLITVGCAKTASVEPAVNLKNTSTSIPQNTNNTLNTIAPKPAESYDIINSIDLAFIPHEIKPLKEGAPDERWVKGNSYSLELPDKKEAILSFYWDNQTEVEQPTIKNIYAYLKVGEKVYNLGLITGFGFDGIEQVKQVELTNDGIKEFLITGNAGATCANGWVIGYKDGKWYYLLDYSNLDICDLNEDVIQELTATSRGSLPTFVEIFRWTGNCFESTDVSKHTKMTYSTLYEKNGRWIIESGNANEPNYYMYTDGKLNQILFDEE